MERHILRGFELRAAGLAAQQDCSIQEKIDLEIRIREGIWKLLSLSTQKGQILQAVKNLMVCNARIMAYTLELQKLEEQIANQAGKCEENFESKERTACRGKIAISDVRIPLMWKDSDHFSNKERSQHYAIFCLFKMGAEVFDTEMVIVDKTITDICFENVTIFNEAGPDFQIKVEVYSCCTEESSITNTPKKLAKKLKTSISKATGKKISSVLQEDHEMCLSFSSAIYGAKYNLLAHTTLSLESAEDSFKTHNLSVNGNGMPKEKYDPPDPRRIYTIMSAEEVANGKKSHWAELEISGRVRSLSTSLWSLTHLTALHLNDNYLSRIPPDIAKLHNLVYLDLSSNKLRSLPAELGNMVSLRELLLNNNLLRVLPYELGRLFQLQTLGLKGNPLSQDILNLYQDPDGTRKLLNFMLDNLAVHPEQLPPRPWITLKERDQILPSASFTVMCYNVLCDKYATRQLYGYCPSWALNWEYRKKGIMEEIVNCDADIISLQALQSCHCQMVAAINKEVETEQYFTLFLPALKERGYDGFFSPKSRAKIMSEQERKHVDGCAIFFKTEKFTLVQKHTVEFNQVAMANSDGSEAMLNRVMTKDNIGVAVVLEVHKELFGAGMKPIHAADKQLLIVANAHMHWDPEYSDVKLIQTMMFVSEVKNILEKASSRPGSPTADPNSIPLVLCADLNSLPDSGVVEYLSNGGVADNHKDFKELRYNECLMNFSCNGKNGSSEGRITHGFQLKSAYENNLMPYTNYTFDFKGVIDYIFYSKTHMNVLGVLGPLDPQWLVENNITGCPHPHIPSDHFSLLTQLELHPPLLPLVNGVHLPNRR